MSAPGEELAAAAPANPAWDLDALLDDPATTTIVCAGSGGVGKTTTAAALALRAADRGRGVVVLTVDPSRRLAQVLGVDPEVAGEPHPVAGVAAGGGSLHAAVLDARAVLDAMVEQALEPERAAALRANPVYASVASSFSGTQEYMAMERVGQLRAAATGGDAPWDLVVVDTPPSRSALDFIDAPARLGRFVDGRFVRLLRRSGGGGRTAGLASRLTGGVSAAMDKVLGATLLSDVQQLVGGLDVVFGGFQERARATSAALAAQGSAFVVVTAAEDDALAESAFLLTRLARDGLPTAALVVNRAAVAPAVLRPVSAGAALAAAAALQRPDATAGPDDAPGADLALGPDDAPGPDDASGVRPDRRTAAALLRVHADVAAAASDERARVLAVLAEHPGVAVALVPERGSDVHELDALRAVAADLAGAPHPG